MESTATAPDQPLLSIIHQTPVGIVSMDAGGVIAQINPTGVQYLMPLFWQYDLSGDNLFEAFDPAIPQLRHLIAAYAPESGPILDHHCFVVPVSIDEQVQDRYFSLSVYKVSPDQLTVYFDDLTDFVANLKPTAAPGPALSPFDSQRESASLQATVDGYLTQLVQQLDDADLTALGNLSDMSTLLTFVDSHQADLRTMLGDTTLDKALPLLYALLDHQQTALLSLDEALTQQRALLTQLRALISPHPFS